MEKKELREKFGSECLMDNYVNYIEWLEDIILNIFNNKFQCTDWKGNKVNDSEAFKEFINKL